MKYTPLHVHSHGSLLDGLNKPDQIVKRLEEIGSDSCALTDHGSISLAVNYLNSMHNAEKKPIIGCELYVCDLDASIKDESNRSLSHLLVYAKNDDGWRQLVRLISESNSPDNFYYKPRLSLNQLSKYSSQDLLWASGHLGSVLGNVISNGDLQAGIKWVEEFHSIFGRDNFFLEVQLIAKNTVPEMQTLTDIVREIGQKTNTKVIATPDAHYCNRQDAEDQRILLCRNLGNITLEQARNKDVLSCFFNCNDFHIPSYDEMIEVGHTEEELDNTNFFSASCTDYKEILQPPMSPTFECPEGMNQDEYLRELCREGWKRKIEGVIPKNKQQVYIDRVKEELSILQGANLSNYFLVVQDILRYVNDNNWLPGPGRGCLTKDNTIFMGSGDVKSLDKIKIGDEIINNNGVVRKVLNTFKYNCTETLLKIKCYYGDNSGVTLTKDHKILSAKTHKLSNKSYDKKYDDTNLELFWHKASELSVGDWVFFPKIKRQTVCNNNDIDLSIYSHDRVLTHNHSNCYHNIINGLTKNINRVIQYDRIVKQDKDWFYFLGLFTADGWFVKNKPHLIGLAFNSQDEDKIKYIEEYFTRYNIQTTRRYHKTSKLVQLDIRCYHLVQHLKVLFNHYKLTSATKHVPKCVLNTNIDNIIYYLWGYCDGDGHVESNRIKYSTISKTLAYQIKYLYGILNIPCSIRHYKRSDKRGYPDWIEYCISVPHKEIKNYHYKVVNDGILLRIREIKEIYDVNTVYDLEIDDPTQNYLTSSFIVHNSAAGCLVSYLINITQVDPIKYDLLFSRFYNAGRNTKDHISMPDIDIDVPVTKREKVIQYIKDKYGHNKVAQMITYQTMKGRGALKDVLRAYGVSFVEMNEITKYIPEEAKIADELQQMKENTGESSIIRWTLEHDDKGNLRDWCYLDDDGNLQGPYAKRFEQAIRLEGTKASQSKHAAGIVITPQPMSEICPMIYDTKTKNQIAGLEMDDLEAIGGLKLDILGIAMLSKIMGVKEILETGDIVI